MMEEEVVRRRGWLTREEFLDLLGATNLLPGPNSTEMAIHVGHRRAGLAGLVVAGTCFIVPAALITLALAWAYVRFGSLPIAEAVFHGVKPVVIAIVGCALVGFARTALRTRGLVGVALAAVVAGAAGAHELAILLGAGLVVVGMRRSTSHHATWAGAFPAAATMPAAVPAATLTGLFLFFLKVGAVLFGSGYVLLAFLRADLVDRWGWLSEGQLLDAVAAGQMTPGPVFTTATFVGYLVAGVPGAAVSTIGIFLPAFVFVGLSGPLIPRIRRSPVLGDFLDGVIVGSLALMAVVTMQLGRVALVDPVTVATAAASALLLWHGVNSAWLVLGGCLVGLGAAR
jgi:chromate transporter